MTENVLLNVLVIESNPDVRSVFAELLDFLGCSVVSIAEYSHADEDSINLKIDVVIMELLHAEGPDVCLRLHHSASTRHALLIATITYDDGSLMAKAEISGIKHVLTKPLDLTVLLNLLKTEHARRMTER